ncbi:MAG: type II toxin-antitoxin system RelE/ParE family toxin [Chloroflexi bacterium]|nr:type II toxin-antitoxin system RelE/ParE family toxin [Chloroflexota bacterium]
MPGNMRQRIKRAVDDLSNNPFPPGSKQLEWQELEFKLCRLQIEKWRVIYLVNETELTVDVLGVRKRPPYDYGDLDALLSDLE